MIGEHMSNSEGPAERSQGNAGRRPSVENSKEHDAGEAEIRMPDGTIISLPVLRDKFDNVFIDIQKLQPSTGICVFDPGFTSTASCNSTITYIDGMQGKLLYRGYPIEQIAEKGDFYDAAYLLIHGDLPSKSEKDFFHKEITRHTLVHEHLIHFFRGFRHDAHPMAIMCGVVGGLSAFYSDKEDVFDPEKQVQACYRLIAKMPTLAAMSYKTAIGQPIMYPRNDLTFTENFLYMMFATPCEEYKVSSALARALEIIFILHLDHEQNASTTTVRTAGSSQANPFACMASGIAALWGPAHGGANEAVLRMLQEIQDMGGIPAIPRVIERARDRNDSFRLMGFGHRVYKTFDPRAKIMRQVCKDVLGELGRKDQLLDLAMELEKVALTEPYFIERNLYPNVDFYSGIVLRALGIPIEMYTVMFAIARSVGWVSQWKELMSQKVTKITRPRQIFMGNLEREFIPIEERCEVKTETELSGQRDSTKLSSSQRTIPSTALGRSVSTYMRCLQE